MPYNLSIQKLSEFIAKIKPLDINYQSKCDEPKPVSILSSISRFFNSFSSGERNIDRMNDIIFSQNLAASVESNMFRYALWDNHFREKGSYHPDTILFLKKVLAGSLLLDAMEIRATYWIESNYKNSSLVQLVLEIFEINDLNEVPKIELKESLQALERYMDIVQQQTPGSNINWHPAKTFDELLVAIKRHIPEGVDLAPAGISMGF